MYAHLRTILLAEDMGLPSMFVPGTSKQINIVIYWQNDYVDL